MTAVLDALEAKLRADPGDWSSWLVFGDWLLDQGDVRGELITLEHQLDTQALSTATRHAHVRRIAEIEREHRPAWLDGLDLPPRAAPVWRNGFVVGVWTPVTPALLRSIDAWHRHRTARFLGALDLTQSKLRADELDQLLQVEAMTRFTSLALRDNDLTDRAAAVVARARTLVGLHTLDLSDNTDVGPDGAAALASATLPALQALDLDRCPILDTGAIRLAAAPFLPTLRRLQIRRGRLGADGVQALAGRAERLERLRLSDTPVGTQGLEALVRSRAWPALRWLDLRRASIGSLRALLPAERIRHLQLLDISGNEASHAEHEAILDACRANGCKTAA